MTDEYKKPYLHLFNAVTDAIEQMEAQKFDLALWTLERGQQESEELFIQHEDDDPGR